MRDFRWITPNLMLLIVLILSGIAYGAPKALVDEYVYNVGDIPQGQQIIHDFIIKNAGDEPLTIQAKPC
jgi:hypothetical protein